MTQKQPPRLTPRPSSHRLAATLALFTLLASVGCSQEASEPNAGSDEEAPHSEAKPNRLIHETSPYLLQHAYNPVDWFPWGEDAFAKAKRENKPIFLSIGYSTCYWCHVMEVESFEDPEVAALLNEHYVAIKVDREERPDIDEQYMLATQLSTGRGGWPNSVWLTPEGKPWMAGTYFPKPRFMSALKQLTGFWENRREEIEQQASQLSEAIAQAGGAAALVNSNAKLEPKLVDGAIESILERFDTSRAGFGSAPKFPPHGTLQLLIGQYRKTNDDSLLEPVAKTLDAMWLGGMHDHIGGGFHRYSTDENWLLPHFEKMLYDNAQLLRAYADGYLITKSGRYRSAVKDIFRWLQREMTAPEGAFYSAIDSGEVGKEGKAYVWYRDQLDAALPPEQAALFGEIYNFETRGNFVEESTRERTGANIPHLKAPINEIAEERNEDPEKLAHELAEIRAVLFAYRQTWEQPHKDTKTLTSWNGLMISALAYAGRQLDSSRYTQAAAKAADFILEKMTRDGQLLRVYRQGEAKLPGYLDDYAYFADALVELYLATGEERWLLNAQTLADTLLDDFQDQANGGFYFTTDRHEDLITRSKNLGGGGNLPDANGVAIRVLLRLAKLAGQTQYAEAAQRALEAMAGVMQQSPYSSEYMLLAAADFFGDQGTATASPKASAAQETPFASTSPDVSKSVNAVDISVYSSRLKARPGETIDLAVSIDIDNGWHLYGENPDADFLIPTTVTAELATPLAARLVETPQPHSKLDPVLKQTLHTYTGRIWYRLRIDVAPDAKSGTSIVSIEIETQACDESRCLPPETTTLSFPIQIDPAAEIKTRHPTVFSNAP